MRTAKSLIRLGRCPGWSVFAGRTCHFVGFVTRRLKLLTTASLFFLCMMLHLKCNNRAKKHMSRLVTKPTMWLCVQLRLRSTWASAQSDQSLHCLHEESLGPELPIEHTAKTLIRLGICPGWSDQSSLSAWRSNGSLATYKGTQLRLIRRGVCPGWSESSLGRQVILFVLSCSGFSFFLFFQLSSRYFIVIL